MQFSCAQCSTKYAVPDDKVRGKRIRTKCRKCGAEIVVDGPGARPSIPPASRGPASLGGPASAGSAPARPAQPSSGDDERWTVAIDRTTQKKMTGMELVEAFGRQEVGEETLVWKQGMEDWKQLFDVPVIAIALRARGYEPGKEPAPPAAGQKPGAPGGAWDDENEATRVVDGALQFPVRAAPGPRPVPAPAPVPGTRPVPAPAPVPMARPPAPKAPPSSGGFDDEDEATRVVAAIEAKDLLAPLSARKPAAPLPPKPAGPGKFAKTQLGMAAPPPPAPAAPKTLPVPEAPPLAPRSPASAPSSMDFEDEATAVIAPDRAKELLDEEARKSQRRPEQPTSPGPLAETPMGFGFDDEATLVVAPERAGQLLGEKKPAVEVIAPKAPEPAPREPAPAPKAAEAPSKPAIPTPTPAAGRPATEDARKSGPGDGAPSVVLTEPREAPGKAAASIRDLSGISHEPTRVVRVTKKKSSGTLFWVTLFIALAAAAVGGFVASRLADGKSLPGWMRLR